MYNPLYKKFLALVALAVTVTAAPATDRCPRNTQSTVTFTVTPPPTVTLPTPTKSSCSVSICADYINECGMMYGGCFLAPECGGTWPTFTPPPCPTCTLSICADYIDACGQGYGGCFLAPQCGGTWPTFSTPPCTPTPTPTITKPTVYPTKCQVTSTICTDRYNPCSPWNIGTCYLNPECGGTTLAPPNTVCSATTTAEVTTTLGEYERVKRMVEWVTWTTTIPEVTPTVNWDFGL